MCGRVCCTLNPESISSLTSVPVSEFKDLDSYEKCRNVQPGNQYLPVWYRDHSNRERQCIQFMKWGLIPSYQSSSSVPNYFLMFNARSETVDTKPAFRRLIHRKRCIVLVSGYYEWKHISTKEKQPYYISSSSTNVLFLAGLYDSWLSSTGDVVYTCTILTKPHIETLKWLHDRMPVILEATYCHEWLAGDEYRKALDAITTGDSLLCNLDCYPVTKKIGKASYQEDDCCSQIDIKVADSILKYFTEAKKVKDAKQLCSKRQHQNVSDMKINEASKSPKRKKVKEISKVQTKIGKYFSKATKISKEMA